MSYFGKLRGDNGKSPPRAPARTIVVAWLGGVLALAVVGWLAHHTGQPWVLGSFGASCVLVFGFPEAPFSQPRSVVFGHLLSSLVGLIFLTVFGPQWWAMALAGGTAIAVMMLTRTVHPPAGSNPVIVFLSHPGWSFLLLPTLLGAVAVATVGWLYNNAARAERYPKYWV